MEKEHPRALYKRSREQKGKEFISAEITKFPLSNGVAGANELQLQN